MLKTSPCLGVKPPAAERSRDRVLTDAELHNVWLAAGKIGGPFGALVQLLALTGQRRDEVAQMEWAVIDLAGRLWALPPAARSPDQRPRHCDPDGIAAHQRSVCAHDERRSGRERLLEGQAPPRRLAAGGYAALAPA
jgi:hypothetical protein